MDTVPNSEEKRMSLHLSIRTYPVGTRYLLSFTDLLIVVTLGPKNPNTNPNRTCQIASDLPNFTNMLA
jgi:hypothetical protein